MKITSRKEKETRGNSPIYDEESKSNFPNYLRHPVSKPVVVGPYLPCRRRRPDFRPVCSLLNHPNPLSVYTCMRGVTLSKRNKIFFYQSKSNTL